MSVRVIIFGLLACVLFAGLGGCCSPSAETGRNSSPQVVMALKPEEKRTTATVRIGDELRFVLPPAPGPGFVWQIVSNDPRCLRQSGGLAGGPDGTSVAFIAQRPSRSYIRFGCVRATGAKEEEIVDAYQILVTIRN